MLWHPKSPVKKYTVVVIIKRPVKLLAAVKLFGAGGY
jgi:hypothetical protein